MVHTDASASEAQIRELMERRAAAVRARDAVGMTEAFAPDVVSFDVVNPLRTTGTEGASKRAEQWIASFDGPIGYEMRDLTITADGDVAFCHSLNQVRATTVSGQRLEMWWRATVCFRRVNGQWLVAHEHSSVPFDPETGNASMDLVP